MSECAVHTGILFSRQTCGQPAALHCGRCNLPLCKSHVVPQPSGPFLCPQCDRYENDGSHEWEYDGGGWRWRGARTGKAGAAVAAAGLDDEDEDGFAADERAADPAAIDPNAKDSDFDAS